MMKCNRSIVEGNNVSKSLCFTGHRPEKLNGYDPADNVELLKILKATIEHYIVEKDVSLFISGMALGIDMWAARIVLNLKKKYTHIKLQCAIPCCKQYEVWKDKRDIDMWFQITSKADEVHYVSSEPYTAWCLQKRNEYMVDNSDYIIAVWDGTRGGTFNCINYARKKNKEATIEYINPNDYK